jgi:hypothetical protein
MATGRDGYNLALRIRHAGYPNVYWYRGGREAYSDGRAKRKPPDIITLDALRAADVDGHTRGWLDDRKNRRIIPHRLESCGYIPVRNPDAPTDGLWKIQGKRRAIYARKELSLSKQIAAARGSSLWCNR